MIRGIEFEAERGLTLDFRGISLIDSQSVSSGGNFFVIEKFFETEKVFANKTLIPGKVHKSSTAINWSKRVSRDQRVSLCWTWFLWPELRLTIFSQVYFYCFFFFCSRIFVGIFHSQRQINSLSKGRKTKARKRFKNGKFSRTICGAVANYFNRFELQSSF